MRRSPLSRSPSRARGSKAKRSGRDQAGHLIERLREKLYPPGEWGLVSEVRNTTGDWDVIRYADAVAVHRFEPVDGYRIHGFEVKTSRQDFLREIGDPEKAGPLKLFCAAYWLVVPAPRKKIILSVSLELPDPQHVELACGHGGVRPLDKVMPHRMPCARCAEEAEAEVSAERPGPARTRPAAELAEREVA